MIPSLHIEADVTASVGDHEVRIHGERNQFVVDASSWAPLLRLQKVLPSLPAGLPAPPRTAAGSVKIRVRGSTVITLRFKDGRIRRRLHPLGITRSLFV
ncbi:MAG: hypothetical protein OSA40_11380 [Phycisphaerales bacterium]|nr:hypothetical protein [Phycisphaerales bacterium]